MSMKHKSIKNLLKGIFLVGLSPFTGFADEIPSNYEAKLSIPSVYDTSPSQVIYQQFLWGETMENGYQHLLMREGIEFNMHMTNGVPTTFMRINTLDEFLNELQKPQGADVVILDANLSINQALYLRDNVTITGQRFEYAPGMLYDVSTNHTKASISSNADVFVIGKNNTIRDLTLNVQDHHAAVKNAGSSVGHLTLEQLTSNGSILIETADSTNDSVIKMSQNKLDLSAGDNLVGFKIINKSGANVIEDFSGNEVTFESGDYNTGYMIGNHEGSQIIYYFGNNIAGFSSATQGSNGFIVNNYGELQSIDNFYRNTATFLSGSDNTGLTLYNHENKNNPDNNIQQIDQVSMNIFTFGKQSQSAAGVYIESMGLNQNIGSVDNNVIIIEDGRLNEAFKVYNDRNYQTIQSISNNAINLTGSQELSEVFDIQNFSKAQIINNLSQNMISFQDATGSKGFDIENNDQQQLIGNLSENKFNLSGTFDDFQIIKLQSEAAKFAETVINGMRNNQVLGNDSLAGIILSASYNSNIQINIDGATGVEVPLEALSLNNNNMPVQDTNSGGAVMVTEIVN